MSLLVRIPLIILIFTTMNKSSKPVTMETASRICGKGDMRGPGWLKVGVCVCIYWKAGLPGKLMERARAGAIM